MARVETSLYRVLEVPWVYERVQMVFGADRDRTTFADKYVRAKLGDRVVEIGCGLGEIVRYLKDVDHTGYAPNPDYVD